MPKRALSLPAFMLRTPYQKPSGAVTTMSEGLGKLGVLFSTYHNR